MIVSHDLSGFKGIFPRPFLILGLRFSTLLHKIDSFRRLRPASQNREIGQTSVMQFTLFGEHLSMP